jgi:hypothetical protein
MEYLPDDPNFQPPSEYLIHPWRAGACEKCPQAPPGSAEVFSGDCRRDGIRGEIGHSGWGEAVTRCGGALSPHLDARPAYGYTVVIRRTADAIIKRLTPLKSMLTPTSVPIAQASLAGHVPQIIRASSSVTMPSNKSHPDPFS